MTEQTMRCFIGVPVDHHVAQVFPSAQGRLWAVEGLQVPVPMRQLHGALTGLLGRLGLPLEARPLRPHVTLLRGLQASLRPPVYRLELAMPVSSLVLYESRQHAGDSEYRVLESASLAG